MIERILTGGRIYTQDPQRPWAQALAIANGRIVAVGDDAAIRALASAQTRHDDLGGQLVIPGLIDAHLHAEWTALAMQSVNLFEVPSKAEALARVAARVAQGGVGWLRGHGWAQGLWPEPVFPTASDLDAITGERPCYFAAKSGHAAWVNSAALRLAGIDAQTPNPAGGEIVRDASGQATGILLETAMQLVAQCIPTPTLEELAGYIAEMQQAALASGLTMFHDYDNPNVLAALQVLRERGQLNLRVLKHINKPWLDDALRSGIRFGLGDDWLRMGNLKMFADGALGPLTAWMLAPYEGQPSNTGIIVTPPDEMLECALRATRGGLPTTIHAIGDAAVRAVLDIFEQVRAEEARLGILPAQRRHRIEHVQVIHADDVPRMRDLNIIASMQPLHATSDWTVAERHWGARCGLAYNAKVQLAQGVVCAFGSDSPIEPFEPFKGIHAAVTRQRADATPAGGWYPELRLTVAQALQGFTLGAAYAAGLEDRLGQLAAGYLADLVVLDRDIFSIPAEDLLHVGIVGTMVGGTWRYGGI